MDWNDIKFVLAVAEYGSLNGAAKKLGVNHSTVFRRLQSLEQTLGVQLVIPSRRGYKLSVEGEQLVQYGKVMQANADAIALDIGGQSVSLSGVIRITAPGTIANETLPPLLHKFLSRYPDIQFEVIEAGEALDLSRREADIALRSTANPPEHLIGRKLSDVRWGVYCHEDEFERLASLSHEQYFDEPWVGYMDSFPALSIKWVHKEVPNDAIRVRMNSVAGCISACKNGLGLAFIPNNEYPGLKLLWEPEVSSKVAFWILMPKELRKSAKISTFYQFLVEELGQPS